MDKRRLQVMQRRQALLAKISGQREQLSEIGTRWQPALHVADQAWLAARFMRRHPLLVAGLAGLAVVRRSGVTGLVKGAWRVWKGYQLLNALSRKITPRA
ncbi:MAG: YqjK-like family protein [Proteobacteria bacterium]|nr:YqjK-like family protein [Pseudomonadota bacterium]